MTFLFGKAAIKKKRHELANIVFQLANCKRLTIKDRCYFGAINVDRLNSKEVKEVSRRVQSLIPYLGRFYGVKL